MPIMLFSNSILLDSLVILTVSLAVAKLVIDRRSSHLATPRGPRSDSIFFGNIREVVEDTATVTERWVSEYGYVFKVPAGFGTSRIMITDPKAVAHVFANDSFGYQRPTLGKTFTRTFVSVVKYSSIV
jgi:hypothetical protein